MGGGRWGGRGCTGGGGGGGREGGGGGPPGSMTIWSMRSKLIL